MYCSVIVSITYSIIMVFECEGHHVGVCVDV